MHSFEILIAQSSWSQDGGPFVPDRLFYEVPDEAQELLEPILSPYGQDPIGYFDMLNFGRPPAPWALVCFDRDYAIGGHIAASRPSDAGIAFAPYNPWPDPVPPDFVPGVGVLTLASKSGLERAAGNSPVFAAAWTGLRECSGERNWLVILDPLPQDWLTKVLPGDRECWFASRRQ